MADLKYKVLVASTPELAARRLCAWVNGPGVKVEIISVSQLVVGDKIYTTILWKTSDFSLGLDNSDHKSRPKIGERRLKHQPLKIDRLPVVVRDAICILRSEGVIWSIISRRSALPFSLKWKQDGGGFVDWSAVSPDAAKAFPGGRIPETNLARWYDLRIEQNQARL